MAVAPLLGVEMLIHLIFDVRPVLANATRPSYHSVQNQRFVLSPERRRNDGGPPQRLPGPKYRLGAPAPTNLRSRRSAPYRIGAPAQPVSKAELCSVIAAVAEISWIVNLTAS